MSPFARTAPGRRSRRSHRLAPFIARVATLAFAPFALHAVGDPAVIDDGTVILGVDFTACLNVDTGPAAPTTEGKDNPFIYGLRHIGTGHEGVSGGTPYEGWGIAFTNIAASAGAISQAAGKFGGSFNLNLQSYQVSGVGTEKVSNGRRVVIAHGIGLGPGPEGGPSPVRVTHDFHPSEVPGLYEVTVQIDNLSHGNLDPRYRRIVDWDVEPAPFMEYVTFKQGPSTAVVASSGNGFLQDPDPLIPLIAGGNSCGNTIDFTDCGPAEHGGAFDIEIPTIPVGGSAIFWLYYGAATNEANALAALDTVGASAYSFGQSATNGTPITFVLGFKAPWAIVDNGTIALGVDMFGSLNVHGGTIGTGGQGGGKEGPTRGVEIPITGLRHLSTNYDGTAPGTPREGWGIADLDGPIGGGTFSLIGGIVLAPEPEGDGPTPGENMTPVDLDVLGAGTLPGAVGRRAIVTTLIGEPAILSVIHDFRPSSQTPNLYRVLVDVKNLTKTPTVVPRYRRIADWDVAPPPFSDEFITTVHSFGVVDSMGNGFVPPNPVVAWVGSKEGCSIGPHDECGPADIGMGFELEFDEIPALGREQFLLFYGSTANEATALAALSAVGATAYAIGEKPILFAPEGSPPPPPVWAFGFRDVLFVDDFETSDTTRWSETSP